MAWQIEFAASVEKELRRIGPEGSRRVLKFLRERVAPLENPRSLGDPLRGPELGRFWRYKTGDYRIIADIQDSEIRILVVRVGNRKEVYR